MCEVLQARCHYRQAIVDGVVYDLNDDAYIQVSNVYSRVIIFREMKVSAMLLCLFYVF